MGPLITDMVQDDPTKRPTMEEVLTRFSEIRGKLGTWKLRSRIARKDELLAGHCLEVRPALVLHDWLCPRSQSSYP